MRITSADTELRHYRDPTLGWIIGLYEALAVVIVFVAAASAGRHTTWWILGPSLALMPFPLLYLAIGAWRAGVYESSDGLLGRSFASRSSFTWNEIASVEYFRFGGREVVVITRKDRSRTRLYGARRRMRWAKDDAATDDFVALLTERLPRHQEH